MPLWIKRHKYTLLGITTVSLVTAVIQTASAWMISSAVAGAVMAASTPAWSHNASFPDKAFIAIGYAFIAGFLALPFAWLLS